MNKKIFPFLIYLAYVILLTLVPFRLRPLQLHHFPWPIGPLRWNTFDLVANIFLFLPFGFISYFFQKTTAYLHRGLKTMLIAGCASVAIETLQIIVQGRFPSFLDILTNTLGAGIGFVIVNLKNISSLIHTHSPSLSSHFQRVFRVFFFLYAAFLLSLSFSWGEPFSNWSSRVKILIGNNPKQTLPWHGTLYALAIYNRALTQDQIEKHFVEGPSSFKRNTLPYSHPMALYTFENHSPIFPDRSSIQPPLNLYAHPLDSQRASSLSGVPSGLFLDGSVGPIASEEGSKIYEQIRLNPQLTVEVWMDVQPQEGSGGRLISFVQGNRTLLYLHQDLDEMIFCVLGGLLKRGRFHSEGIETMLRTPSANDPVHLVGVYDPEQVSLFVNGHYVAGGFLTNGFFGLFNRLNLDRMPFGGRGLLGLALFGPFGLFLSLSLKRSSTLMTYGLGGVFFVGLILIIQAQPSVLFFAPQTMWIPVCAQCFGMLAGEFMKRKLF